MKSAQAHGGAPFPLTLGVIGHVRHWTGPDGEIWAYEPYVREMRLWADLFQRVIVCAPRGRGGVPGDAAPFCRPHVLLSPVRYRTAPGRWNAIVRLLQVPGLSLAIWRAVRRSDFVNLRSPGHCGLVGASFVRAMKKPSLTKWAGIHGPYPGEPAACRLERALQSRPHALHPVLVYGPPTFPHEIEFIPALMSGEELEEAGRLSAGKAWVPPWRLLCVGRLSVEKGFDLALRGLGELRKTHVRLSWQLTIIGDGPERGKLEALAIRCGIEDRTRFVGARPFREAQEEYVKAHVVLMPGVVEGWPKVIAEAWAHGAIPVGAAGGIVPHILRGPDSGVVFSPDSHALAVALAGLLASPGRMADMSAGLCRFPRELTLERFKERLEQVLAERCGLPCR